MSRATLWILPALLLCMGGCLSYRARASKLADVQCRRVDELLRKDGTSRAADALRITTRFLQNLPPHPSLDGVRARMLVKRAEVHVARGDREAARADLEAARNLGLPRPDGVPVRVPDATELAARMRCGSVPVPVPSTERFDSPRAPESPVEVSELLFGWGVMPLSLEIERDTSRVPGSTIDAIADLGLGDPVALAGFASFLRLSDRFAVGLSIRGGAFSGEAFLSEELSYDGAVFPAGERVRTRLRCLEGEVSVRPFRAKFRATEFSAEIGVRYLNLDLRIHGETMWKEDRIDAFFPVLGFSLRHALPTRSLSFLLEGKICGWVWDADDFGVETYLAEGTAGLLYEVSSNLSVFFGFRGEVFRYALSRDGQDKEAAGTLIGPLLGVDLRL